MKTEHDVFRYELYDERFVATHDLQVCTCFRIFVDAGLRRSELNCSRCRTSARLGSSVGNGKIQQHTIHTCLGLPVSVYAGVAHGAQEFEFGV